MATDMEVANRLIALREKLKQDQKTFAKSLDIEKNTYNAYERGKRPLTMETAKKIRKKYGISTDWLLYGDLGQPNREFIMQIEADRAPVAIREPAKPAKKKRAVA